MVEIRSAIQSGRGPPERVCAAGGRAEQAPHQRERDTACDTRVLVGAAVSGAVAAGCRPRLEQLQEMAWCRPSVVVEAASASTVLPAAHRRLSSGAPALRRRRRRGPTEPPWCRPRHAGARRRSPPTLFSLKVTLTAISLRRRAASCHHQLRVDAVGARRAPTRPERRAWRLRGPVIAVHTPMVALDHGHLTRELHERPCTGDNRRLRPLRGLRGISHLTLLSQRHAPTPTLRNQPSKTGHDPRITTPPAGTGGGSVRSWWISRAV